MNNIRDFIYSGFTNDASRLVNVFRERVLADGGTFESAEYLTEWTKQNQDLFNRSAFVLTPNGYKAGTLYSFKGQDFNTFSRTTSGTRIKNNFQLEIMGVNVPRIDYEHQTPTFLSEIISTNLWWNNQSQTFTVLNGRRYTLSFFGSGTVTVTGAYTATVVGNGNTIKKIEQFGNALTVGTSVTLTVTGDVFQGNFVISSFNNLTSATLSSFNQPTSHIPTTTSNITRSFDSFSNLNVGTLLQDKFLLMIDYISGADSFANGTVSSIFQIHSFNTPANNVFSNNSHILYRNGVAFSGAQSYASPLFRNYGVRHRLFFYADITNGISVIVSSILESDGWKLIRNSLSNSNPFTNDYDRLRLADGGQGRMTIKFKSVAVLKDFTGISNIRSYIQQLALKPSI